jgi:hypothetical protein
VRVLFSNPCNDKKNNMDIFNSFATDEVAETEGRWFPIGKGKDSKVAKVLVARTGNANYVKALRQRMKDSQVDTEDASEENEKLVTDLVTETMAETILLGWKGLEYKGESLEYTKANAKLLLEVKGFRQRISGIADKLESFRIRDEEDQGND